MTRVTTATQAAAAAEAEGVDPNLASKSEFARLNGWSKSYVSKLAGEGRLVVTEDGRQVLVAESLARIAETTRATERASPPALTPVVRADRDRKDFYDAENARLDLAERVGKLMDRAEALSVASDVGTYLRTTLESWCDVLTPDLAAAGGDEPMIRAMLRDRCRELLGEFSRRMAKLEREAAA